jgi:acyl-CoA dehydrogenase
MIDFELTPDELKVIQSAHEEAEKYARPIARYYDEHEHEEPTDLIKRLWDQTLRGESTGMIGLGVGAVLRIEEACWGDAGLMLANPGSGLGGAAILQSGTPDQQKRFLARFGNGDPKWGAMAMTEPGCGSDTSAIQTTAVREGNEWILNGEKIFITGGARAFNNPGGVIVVWATVDKSAGRAGMKPFVVEQGTPGMRLEKLEKKLGIRASDTASIVFENCRIPYENILGSPEVRQIDASSTAGFRRAMATFDATRPIIAAMALGVARASLDFVKQELDKQGVKIRYGVPKTKLTSIERDVMDMESAYKAAKMLMMRAVWLMSQFKPNSLESSMSKTKAGLTTSYITQKAVELMGPLGYSRKWLLEKWMRDGKINDIFEGTGQINMLVVARRILDFSSRELK